MAAVDANSDFRKALEGYLREASEHLEAHGVGVDRILVSPSPVTWDGGCDGQLWTRIVGVAAISGEASSQQCGVPFWTVTLGLGIIRRISVVSSNGVPPYAEDITEDALTQAEDIRILKDSILSLDTTRTLVSWVPLQQQGGFAGGEWTFTVRVPNIYRPKPVLDEV